MCPRLLPQGSSLPCRAVSDGETGAAIAAAVVANDARSAPQLPHGLNAGGCSGSEVHFIRSGWCLSEGLACQVAASRTPWPMLLNRFGVFGISVKYLIRWMRLSVQ